MMDRRQLEGLSASLSPEVVETVEGPDGLTYCHLSDGKWRARKDGTYIDKASSLEELQRRFENEPFQNGCKKAQEYINQKLESIR